MHNIQCTVVHRITCLSLSLSLSLIFVVRSILTILMLESCEKKRGKNNNNIQVYQFQWHHIRVFCSCCGLCAFLFCSYANVRTLHSLSKNKLLRISTEKNRRNNKYAIFVTRLSSTHTHNNSSSSTTARYVWCVHKVMFSH